MTEISEKSRSELLMLYNIAVNDIERTKQQQWTHIYAILIAQGGLVAILKNSEKPLGFDDPSWTFSLAIFFLTLLGLLLIWASQRRLSTLRSLIEKVYTPCLTEEIQSLLKTDEAKDEFRVLYPVVLINVLVAAFLFFWTMICV